MIYGNYLREKYNNTAVKIADAEGVPCVMEYSKGKNLRNYEIYGNSVQDGTPSPENPVEVQSVGDLVTDTASEYYGKYDVPVRVCGKNYCPNDWEAGFINKNTGVNQSSTTFIRAKDYFTLDRTKHYYISSDDIETNILVNWFFYDENKNFISRFVSYKNRTIGSAGTQVIIPTGTLFYRLAIDTTDITIKVQIEEGTTATEYEPYIGETKHIYLNEPLRKVGDYADYIDFKNQKVVRNIIKQSLNTTAIYKKLNSVIRLACRNENMRQKVDSHMLSTIFNYNYDWFANTECIFHHYDTNWNYYWSVYWNRLGLTYDGTNVYRTDDPEQTPLMDSEIISIAKEWLSKLSDKDKEIYMILDTPTEESVSLPTLKTVKGTSIISVGTSVQPSNIKAKYVKL